MTDSAFFEDERAFQQRQLEATRERLDGGEISSSDRHIALSHIQGHLYAIAVCEYRLGSVEEARQSMEQAAQYQIEFVDATVDLEDEIEGSHRGHRATYCLEALHTSILAGTYQEDAVERTLSIGEDWFLDTYSEFAHVFHYARSLAYLLSGRPAEAVSEANRYEDIEQTYDWSEAAVECLEAIVEESPETVTARIDDLLVHHERQYGRDEASASDDPTAHDYCALEASALFACATDNGIDISESDLREDYVEYLVVL